MIVLTSNYSEIDAEIARVQSMPTLKMKTLLDGALHLGFVETQAAVHVDSGDLKASGNEKSKSRKTTQDWEGEIEYGGKTSGVDYAYYEQRRGVHWEGPSSVKGDHDFMEPVTGEVFNEVMVGAILEGLS